jgi:flagellar biogenesis protein FliO
MRWIYILLLPFALYAVEPASEPTSPPDKVEAPINEEVSHIKEELPSELSPDIYKKQFFRTLIIIVIIGGGALTLIWLMRRFSKSGTFQANQKKNIKILERRQISPNTYLYHIQIGTKQCVISESKCDVRVIANLDWDDSEVTH